MMRLGKYIKPYLVMLIAAIALLFVQANADLALPDYMSRIVNTGIQQGGIANAVPQAIRASQMAKLVLFLDAEEQQLVLASYDLVDSASADYERYLEKYPVLADEPVYVRTDFSTASTDAINPIMAKALMIVGGIEQAKADPEKAAAMSAGDSGFDFSRIPEGADMFALLGMMPANQREAIATSITSQFDALGESGLVQAATGVIKIEYEEMGMNTVRIQSRYILTTGAMMIGLTLLAAACTITVGFLSARIAAGFARDLRTATFERVESYSGREFDKFSTASLITRSTNDIMQIQMVSMMLIRMVFYAPILGVGGIIRAIGKNSSMWWVIAVAVGALMLLVLFVYKVAVPKFKIIQKLMDRLNLVSRESLSGMMVIRAFNMQDREEQKFEGANKDLTDTMLFVNRVMVVMMPFMMFIMNGLTVLILWIGAKQIAASSMQVGDMMAFMQYAMQIVMAFLMLAMMFIMLPRAAVSADRVADVLETEPSINDPENPEIFDEAFDGTIEFKNVSFRYPEAEEDVLHDLSFTARPGEMTAFIGSTGAGKSTVVNLIPRFYDITGGEILVGGKDIRNVTQNALREKIGYIPQKATLFSGTIESNLRYADENASEETLEQSARISQSAEFIEERPEKMAGEISQGGINVSGGQKQRLSIARALVKKPPIFIFDDTFSALDFKTDSNLRKALKAETGGSTVLVVTQRVSTIRNAEQIVVLDEGRIVGTGTHTELMETCETYREIATSQLTAEELA